MSSLQSENIAGEDLARVGTRGLSTIETEIDEKNGSRSERASVLQRSPSRMIGKEGLDILQLEMMLNSLKRMARC